MRTIRTLENNIIQSFNMAKNDIVMLRQSHNKQTAAINQLIENQKALLLRIRELEKKAEARPAEKIMEKKIILTANKIVPKRKEFIGSQSAMKFHDPMCPFAKNIKPKNKIVFKTKVKAFNTGYRACDCLKKV